MDSKARKPKKGVGKPSRPVGWTQPTSQDATAEEAASSIQPVSQYVPIGEMLPTGETLASAQTSAQDVTSRNPAYSAKPKKRGVTPNLMVGWTQPTSQDATAEEAASLAQPVSQYVPIGETLTTGETLASAQTGGQDVTSTRPAYSAKPKKGVGKPSRPVGWTQPTSQDATAEEATYSIQPVSQYVPIGETLTTGEALASAQTRGQDVTSTKPAYSAPPASRTSSLVPVVADAPSRPQPVKQSPFKDTSEPEVHRRGIAPVRLPLVVEGEVKAEIVHPARTSVLKEEDEEDAGKITPSQPHQAEEGAVTRRKDKGKAPMKYAADDDKPELFSGEPMPPASAHIAEHNTMMGGYEADAAMRPPGDDDTPKTPKDKGKAPMRSSPYTHMLLTPPGGWAKPPTGSTPPHPDRYKPITPADKGKAPMRSYPDEYTPPPVKGKENAPTGTVVIDNEAMKIEKERRAATTYPIRNNTQMGEPSSSGYGAPKSERLPNDISEEEYERRDRLMNPSGVEVPGRAQSLYGAVESNVRSQSSERPPAQGQSRLSITSFYSIQEEPGQWSPDDHPFPESGDNRGRRAKTRERSALRSGTQRLVKLFSGRKPGTESPGRSSSPPLRSGQVTPIADRDLENYVSPPAKYRGGVLGTLMRRHGGFEELGLHSRTSSVVDEEAPTRSASPASVRSESLTSPGQEPSTWYQRWWRLLTSWSAGAESSLSSSSSSLTLATLVARSSTDQAGPSNQAGSSYQAGPSNEAGLSDQVRPSYQAGPTNQVAPSNQAAPSNQGPPSNATTRPRSGADTDGEITAAQLQRAPIPDTVREDKIKVEIRETVARQKFLTDFCRDSISYGAPTHRLENYLTSISRAMEIDGHFLYMPGCMIISFDDASTHTTEIKIVRSTQSVDLGKLEDIHDIYKEVVHGKIGTKTATQNLERVRKRKQKYNKWVQILMYGFCSALVGPFAFNASLVDMPMAFLLGLPVGYMQLVAAAESNLYANVFEVTMAIFTSFLARAIDSARSGSIFCFSALAQSSIVLILPGYTMLCASLELQSKNMVAGSVRMVYALIFSLFLGYGITIGTALFGLFNKEMPDTSCTSTIPNKLRVIFVTMFTFCLIIINQGKMRHVPCMVVLATGGYLINTLTAPFFPGNAQISNTLAAFVIGIVANLYSRVSGIRPSSVLLLPAIFVLVPSGLAASGSLVSGVRAAGEIVAPDRNGNGTTPRTTLDSGEDKSPLDSVVFHVGYSMIQVAIAITVGLFLSTLVLYCRSKKRSGLLSF